MRPSAILTKGDFDMKKNAFNVKTLCMGGAIAALYVVLTLVAQAFGLASGAIKVTFPKRSPFCPASPFRRCRA